MDHPPLRITLQRAAEIVDQLVDRPLTDRERYVVARHLQDRVAGRAPDDLGAVASFDAWETVKRRRPDTPRIL